MTSRKPLHFVTCVGQLRWLLIVMLITAPLGLEITTATEIVEEPTELIVVGRLVNIAKTPHCGTFHFGALAIYSDLSVVVGEYENPTVQVIHGCPELSREQYGQGRGDLDRFRIGDFHHLVLTDSTVFTGSVLEFEDAKGAPRYFCKHVTLAKPVRLSD